MQRPIVSDLTFFTPIMQGKAQKLKYILHHGSVLNDGTFLLLSHSPLRNPELSEG